jgi:hypothetical protein
VKDRKVNDDLQSVRVSTLPVIVQRCGSSDAYLSGLSLGGQTVRYHKYGTDRLFVKDGVFLKFGLDAPLGMLGQTADSLQLLAWPPV